MTQEAGLRYVRFRAGERISFGLVQGETIDEVSGSWVEGGRTGRSFALADVTLEPPVDPNEVYNVIAVDSQFGGPLLPAHPRLHHKLPTALTTNGRPIELPPEVSAVRHGGCLVVVIGRAVPRFTPPGEALDYVFGVTAGNDITFAVASPHERRYDGLSWLVGYGADTWAPIGDQVVGGWPGDDLGIEVRVNGAIAARARTGEMRTPVANLISYLSEFIGLDAGDLIFTGGAPALPGSEEIHAGDTVEVEIEGLPLLRNPVVALDIPSLTLATAPASK